MAKRRKRKAAQTPSRPFLGLAIALLGMCGLLWVASLAFATSASPVLRAFSEGIRVPLPYVALLGLVLLGIYFILSRSSAPVQRTGPPMELTQPPSTRGDPASTMEQPWVPPDRTLLPVPRGPASTWGERVFDDIEWRRFEAVCESLFVQARFTAKTQSHGADGGVDIWLYSRHVQGPAALVQCKHWRGKLVGVREVREFFGVMASQKLQRGTFATSSAFTEEALRFAKDNGISALGGSELLALIATRTPEQQQDLLRIAYEGEYWRPTCCGVKMVVRVPKKGGSAFWGCAQYPKCRSTLPMRAA